MCDLQAEELERRQMLSAACFSPEPLPSQSFVGTALTSREAGLSPRAAFGDYPNPVNPNPVEPGGTGFGSARGLDRFPFSDLDLLALRPSAVAGQSSNAVQQEASAIVATPIRADSVSPAAADASLLPTTPDLTSVGRPVDASAAVAVFAAASGVPSPVPTSHPELASASFTTRFNAPTLPVVRLVAQPVASIEGGTAVAPTQSPPSPTASPEFAAPPAPADGERAEEETGRPPPPGPGLLAGLGPFDPAAVERGIQQVLEQLERTGRCLGEQPDETGLSPWIVAGAAAAAACELARRQLKRNAAASAWRPLPGSPLDQMFAG